MDISKKDRQLIDRYLSDQLTGIELEEFMQRMQNETPFRSAIALHAMIQKGIEHSYEKHHKDLVLSSVRYRKPLIPLGLRLIFIFLLVTLSGSLLWFYLAPDTGNKTPQFSLFDNFKNEPSNNSTQKTVRKKATANSGEIVENVDSGKSSDTAGAANPAEKENILMNDSVVTLADGSGDDIVVRKDEMLISADVRITDLNETKANDGKDELSNAAVEKLNPSAGLPEKANAVITTIATEFWVSPINYRGYRLVNNKLILFGIEEPDRVKLYRMKDSLYMSYQNSYYKLFPSDDFLAYQRIRDTEVPLAIRSSK